MSLAAPTLTEPIESTEPIETIIPDEQENFAEQLFGEAGVEKPPTSILERSPEEVLGGLTEPQDCLDLLQDFILVEHKKQVEKEISKYGEFLSVGFTLGQSPEYQKLYLDYLFPTVEKLFSFELDNEEKILQDLSFMLMEESDEKSYQEDLIKAFGVNMFKNSGEKALPWIEKMYDAYLEKVSPHLNTIGDCELSLAHFSGSTSQGLRSRVGTFAGELALILVDEIGSTDVSNESLARYLVSFAGKYPFGSFNSFTSAMEDLGVSISAPVLIEALKSENEKTRRFCSEVLFHLEMGERNVSKGEVKIFGKMFKLVSPEGQKHIVESLTSARRSDVHGNWLTFDEFGKARGSFKLEQEDLTAEDGKVIDKALKTNLSYLFREACISRADETLEERAAREDIFNDYLAHFSKEIDSFHEKTNVWLNNLELHEQAFFWHVYKKAQLEGKGEEVRIENIISKYGPLALKVFVAMEYGETGDDILNFLESETVDEVDKNNLLEGYYELSYLADDWRKVFKNVEGSVGEGFSTELYEAFIRKSTEYLRAAMIISRGEGGELTMRELMESFSNITYSMRVLKDFYQKGDNYKIVDGRPQIQAEYYDFEGNHLIKDARTTWILENGETEDRIVIAVRPKQTVKVGNNFGGEARVNFKIVNKKNNKEARFGLDLSDYGRVIGEENKPPVISLDFGTGRRGDVFPTERVKEIVGIVPGSEGGHNEASFRQESAEYFEAIASLINDGLAKRYPSS